MLNEDKSMLWIGAFRYYCGRMTISVSSFCLMLKQHWHKIPYRAQVVIKRDLNEAIVDDDRDRELGSSSLRLGHDCDRQAWLSVNEFINQEEKV